MRHIERDSGAIGGGMRRWSYGILYTMLWIRYLLSLSSSLSPPDSFHFYALYYNMGLVTPKPYQYYLPFPQQRFISKQTHTHHVHQIPRKSPHKPNTGFLLR